MAKQALLDVLEQTIGKYVRNLDANSLNLAVWSGKIELHGLELDIDAVNAELDRQAALAPNLAIPIRFCSGKFRSFQVDVPWAHLMSRSVVLRAEGLEITVEPYDRTESIDNLYAAAESESIRARRLHEARLGSIKHEDAFRRRSNALKKIAEQDIDNSASKKGASSSTFGSRLVRRIIENIQVEISDVHISLKSDTAAAGVELESFQLVTTDQDGHRAFVDRTVGDHHFLYKSLQINGFGVYLNENKERGMPSIREEGEDRRERTYILSPLSFTAKLRQADSSDCKEYPRYTLESELSALSVMISRAQIEMGWSITDRIRPALDISRPLFPEYRPLSRVNRQTALTWWRYACRCIGRLKGRSLWVEFFRAYRKRKMYIGFYKRHTNHEACSWLQPLSVDEFSKMTEIESDRSISVDGLMIWRNIADAQIEKEQEKHNAKRAETKGSLFTSLFGSPAKSDSTSIKNDEPPIQLSFEEMKELESAFMSQTTDDELDVDSKLCKINFTLGSMRVHLTSYDLNQLAGLEMGKVASSFEANLDGSFKFDLQLTSLEVRDRITVNSLYPIVLRNRGTEVIEEAFTIHLHKTARGGQILKVKLHTFEAVASPVLLAEVRKFIAPPLRAGPKKAKLNPILAQSLSGSVDLFYDATEGAETTSVSAEISPLELQSGGTDFSSALVDAWKEKTKKKSDLRVDLDLHAPVVIVPEDCVDLSSQVLLFDLGHFRFRYGIQLQHVGQEVSQWFKDNPRLNADSAGCILDYGSIGISYMSFSLVRTDSWIRDNSLSIGQSDDRAILEPLTLSVDFGIESCSTDTIPRFCCFAELPSILLTASKEQVARIVAVSVAWSNIMHDLFPTTGSSTIPQRSTGINEQSAKAAGFEAKESITGLTFLEDSPAPKVYINARLARLSLSIKSDSCPGNVLEAHLISVGTSLSSFSDKSFDSQLSMGYFWVVENMQSNIPRENRLLAHSPLPQSVTPKDSTVEMILKIDQIGDFRKVNEALDRGLADIKFQRMFDVESTVSSVPQDESPRSSRASLCAEFSGLCVNWNPLVMKELTLELTKFFEPFEMQDNSGAILISSDDVQNQNIRSRSAYSPEALEMTVSLGKVQFCLNSAKDDLPLFLLTMKETSASFVSRDQEKSDIFVVLGDLSISTPEFGKTESSYNTILGLIPGETQSLLTVKYTESRKTMESFSLDVSDEIEACGVIELSPMRIVYIHSQILAIVEYATEGILGTLAAQAVSSAAAAAVDFTMPSESVKLFRVQASGIEVLLPKAAYSPTFFRLYSGNLLTDYTAKTNSSCVANISLGGFELFDSEGVTLQDCPLEMKLNVILPPDGVGSCDDRAIRVSIDMPRAGLVVPKREYSQLLATLAQNIGDTDLYLRADGLSERVFASEPHLATAGETSITHAGIDFVDTARRIYVNLTISEMSLELDGRDKDDPIIRLSASDTLIVFNLHPDEERTVAEVKLKNLNCDDLRIRSLTRQYRSLVYQQNASEAQDLFSLSYDIKNNSRSSINVVIGSPRLVLIPDAVADVLDFLRNDDLLTSEGKIKTFPESDPVVAIHTEAGTLSVLDSRINEENISTLEFRMTTSRCSIILVDLGTEAPLVNRSRMSTTTISSVTETIAFEGKFEVVLSMTSDTSSGETRSFQAEIHGDKLESYTAFGKNVDSALQLVEPTNMSLYFNMKDDFGSKAVDIRGAVMERLEVILSMRNIALLNAILASISSCLLEESDSSSLEILDDEETKRIEKLATELAADGTDSSFKSQQRLDALSKAVSLDHDFLDSNIAPTALTAFQFTLPQARITLINDFQGLDEPLFRLSLHNSVLNGKVRHGVIFKNQSNIYTGFDFQTNMSIRAEFFDITSSIWKQLLLKSWEVCSKGSRGPTERYESPRPSTAIDVECQTCFLSFSEQFLMGLASANRMWNVYSAATDAANIDITASKVLRKSLAASAARKFVASLPYAVENQTGLMATIITQNEKAKERLCESGSVEYFMFKPPRGTGSAGLRVYGQDIKSGKTVTIVVGGSEIVVDNVDTAIGSGRRSYLLSNGSTILLDVAKEGKTIVILLSSGVEFFNSTIIPFSVALLDKDKVVDLGICQSETVSPTSDLRSSDGKVRKSSTRFGVSSELLRSFRSDWSQHRAAKLRFQIIPMIDATSPDSTLCGFVDITFDATNINAGTGRRVNVTCREDHTQSSNKAAYPPFMFKYSLSTEEVDGSIPAIDIILEPRATLENALPIPLSIRSPMPHIFGDTEMESSDGTHILKQFSRLEFFTPGPSIAIAVKCADKPVCGTDTGWIEGDWIDLPLNPDSMLMDPLRFVLPFARPNLSGSSIRGTEMFIVQGNLDLTEDAFIKKPAASDQEVELRDESMVENHTFYITLCNFAVDHTGEILFEEVERSQRKSFRQSMTKSSLEQFPSQHSGVPLGAFSTQRHAGRVTPLPQSYKPIRLLHLTMEGDEGMVRSSSFCLQDILISSGGVESTAVKWEDGSDSGFYAYRQLINQYQSELHVVPEYVVFNGSRHDKICVRQPGGLEVVIGPGSIEPIRTAAKQSAIISVECISSGGRTAPLNVEGLGLRIAVVRSAEGKPLGSLALQTTTGAFDSRLVIKVGELKRSHLESPEETFMTGSMFQSDHLRFRVQWTELRMSIYEARPIEDAKSLYFESALDRMRQGRPEGNTSSKTQSPKSWVTARQARFGQKAKGLSGPVCTVIFHRFTVDWQRVFKDDVTPEQLAFRSPERAQLSLIINTIQITDDTPNSPYPVVLNSSNKANFFDLCIRLRGPLGADLTTVDLFDLNLAHTNGASEKIIVNTSEEFVWKFLDLADRIVAAAGEFAGLDIELQWDEKLDEYKVLVLDKSTSHNVSRSGYTPPQSEKLYDVKRARVSPFKVVLSFKRAPEASRYKVRRGVRGAHLMNYFTQHLKFKIDRAELKFSRYEVQNVKGPSDRLFELISTVYMSRMKLKFVNLMSAASFEDWKRFADRDDGDDAYMEGDILRVTGNIAGNTANLVFSKAGRGLGKGVSFATGKLGTGIESAAGAVGARALGAGANSVISGVGTGVSDTLTGVGKGAGSVLKGAGQSVGHVFGGVSGGAMLIGKGIGKGVLKGDGKAAASGITSGLSSIGTGVGRGVESVVSGTADGVLSVGQGLFSGMKNAGKGIGAAFSGKKTQQQNPPTSK